MDWSSPLITDGIVVLGFAITGWFQKKKIDALKQNVCSLESTVSAQEKVVKAMEAASHVIDVKKYGEHVKVFEELVEGNARKTIEAMGKQFDEELKQQVGKTINIHETKLTNLTDKTISLLQLVTIMLFYVHPAQRKQLIMEHMEVPILRDCMLKMTEYMNDSWIYPPDSRLSFVLKMGGVMALQD